jgi:hypothetical protein
MPDMHTLTTTDRAVIWESTSQTYRENWSRYSLVMARKIHGI